MCNVQYANVQMCKSSSVVRVQWRVCWHSTVCLLPSQRVTARQEEEDKEDFEQFKEEDKGRRTLKNIKF